MPTPDLADLSHNEGVARPALARYEEDDWIAQVEVLEDRSTEAREAYRVRVVQTLQPSVVYRSVPNGLVFECDQARLSPWRIFTLTLEV